MTHTNESIVENNDWLNKKLLGLKISLPAIILADHFRIRPDMQNSYSEHQIENYQKDISWVLTFLSEAVWAGQPALFDEFISWLKIFLSSLHVPMKDVRESLELLKNRINEACTQEENTMINTVFDPALELFTTRNEKTAIPSIEIELQPMAREYLDHLLKGLRNEAMYLIMNTVSQGTPIKDIYLTIFQPVQYEIGRLWQTNKISVAQEHYCTGATQLVMSQLYPYLFTGEKKNKKMVATCVPGELHEIGARMVTDFFEMEGWDTYYLGASNPIGGVIRYIQDIQPQFVAISATMTFHVSAVQEMVHQIKKSPGMPDNLKIMVGGYPFLVARQLWKQVGADAFATNALDAVNLANKMVVQ